MIKAQCHSDKIDQEMLVVSLRRELEQLRSQKFGESQFADAYKQIVAENKELSQKLDEVERKYSSMVDDYTVSSIG